MNIFQVETGTECHFDIAGSEVIFCSFLKYYWLNRTTRVPGGFGPCSWNGILKFLFFSSSWTHSSSHSPLSLRLHISHRAAFGITPQKSLSAVPTAAMTTAGEPCVIESISVMVCLIANRRATRACMCVQYGHGSSLLFLFF